MVMLILAFICILSVNVPGLVKKKYWRELVVFSVFFILAFTLAFLQVKGVKIPSPVKGIEYLFKNVLGIYYRS